MAACYYIGVDVGTASVRAALVGSDGKIVTCATRPLQIWQPLPDYYEQSSEDVWRNVCLVVKVSTDFFTIRSLANFYCQYADRHMNLKFIRCVSEQEPAVRQFVIVKNKLISVFNASVLLLIMNFVITLSK